MGTFISDTKLLSNVFNTYQVDLKETLHMGGHSEKGPYCSFMKLQTSCSLLNAFCCVPAAGTAVCVTEPLLPYFVFLM